MKKTFIKSLATFLFLLTPVLASDTEIGTEQQPAPKRVTFDPATDRTTKLTKEQIDLYEKVVNGTHTLEEGERFLKLTKKLQAIGQDTLFPKAQATNPGGKTRGFLPFVKKKL